jgi:hypothetical protein
MRWQRRLSTAFGAAGHPTLRPICWCELGTTSLEVSMTTITIALPDDRLLKLKEMATRFGVAPEELVRVSIEELPTWI